MYHPLSKNFFAQYRPSLDLSFVINESNERRYKFAAKRSLAGRRIRIQRKFFVEFLSNIVTYYGEQSKVNVTDPHNDVVKNEIAARDARTRTKARPPPVSCRMKATCVKIVPPKRRNANG